MIVNFVFVGDLEVHIAKFYCSLDHYLKCCFPLVILFWF
jgi:hypothetical protein